MVLPPESELQLEEKVVLLVRKGLVQARQMATLE